MWNANVSELCKLYNNYVAMMVANEKRITDEQKNVYNYAFASKKAIEKTIVYLGYYVEFDVKGCAINIIACGD